jgi:hypothetical protein
MIAPVWITSFSDDRSYRPLTSSGRRSRRTNMVGTMIELVMAWRSIRRSASSGSKLGITWQTPPTMSVKFATPSGAAW